jgi:site-specific recombinase XerC
MSIHSIATPCPGQNLLAPPATPFRKLLQSRHLPKALNADEITRLLAIPNPADPFGLRDRTMLELFYATGIRRSEMPHLLPHKSVDRMEVRDLPFSRPPVRPIGSFRSYSR